MDITEEMLSAGAKLIAEEHGSEVFWPDHEPNEYTDVEREQYQAEARAVIELVAPLIAAQALREAAKHLDDAAWGATELAKRDGNRADLAYAGGLYAAAARLGVRADGLLADECGHPHRVVIPGSP